jgi:hypothetical protein
VRINRSRRATCATRPFHPEPRAVQGKSSSADRASGAPWPAPSMRPTD